SKPVETTVNCPGSFDIDGVLNKSSEVTFSTNNSVKLAGNLVNGSYIEYLVNVSKSGKYELNLDLATTSGDRTLTVYADGVSVGTMKPVATAGWFDFNTYKTVINFTAGMHTLKISTTGSCNIARPSFTEWEEEVNVEVPSSSSTTKFGNDFKVVAYYPSWSSNLASKVQWDKLTHCYYAFGLPDGSGSGAMEPLDSWTVTQMVNACNQNNVVPVLSVGGWSYGNGLCAPVFEKNTNTDAKCLSLAQSIVNAAKQYGFKGVDIDWEYPTSASQAQYKKFMTNLRNLCNENGMILTVAVAATSGSGFTKDVLDMLDFVNLMAYDGNEGSGHSPYSLATGSFEYWHNTMGVPANKLVIGVPFYERPNWADYSYIVSVDPANAQKDSAYINGTTVYYNGIPTMKRKAEYAAKNAAGIMIWEISEDAQSQDLSLLTAIYNTILPIVGTGSTTSATVTDVPGTVKVDSFGGKSPEITINTSGAQAYAGNLNNNSYLDYYIKVAQKGTYTITLNLAAGDAQYNAKNMLVKLNDSTVATVPVIASSSWTTFIGHTATITFAAKGTYKLTLVADSGACNVADFTLTKNEEQTTSQEQTQATTASQPTSSVQPTTFNNTIVSEPEPLEVVGLVVSPQGDNTINVVWGQDLDRINNGQKYNVYVDGVKVLSQVGCDSYNIDNIPSGTKTVKVTATLNNKESAGLSSTVTVTGSATITTEKVEPTTESTSSEEETHSSEDAVIIHGFQISTVNKGVRTVYTVESEINGKKVVSRGMVYSLSSHVNENELYVNSPNSYVHSFNATEKGVISGSGINNTPTSTCYAMTMQYGNTKTAFTTEYRVKAFALLEDGTYVYSDAKTYTVYGIANTLYQDNKMTNAQSHQFLYDNILKFVNPDYEEVSFDYGNTLFTF
ncbi:MAG: carbohydrate-binding protein, partial [Lachnospiraceae bacterium]|nr:carbohydrate-binding protein [Lachnospiraceae bacterium]